MQPVHPIQALDNPRPAPLGAPKFSDLSRAADYQDCLILSSIQVIDHSDTARYQPSSQLMSK